MTKPPVFSRQAVLAVIAVSVLLIGNIIGVRAFTEVSPAVEPTATRSPMDPSDRLANNPSSGKETDPDDATNTTTNSQQEQQNNQVVAKPSVIKESVAGNIIITEDLEEFPLRTYTTQVLPNDPSVNQWWVSSAQLPQLWDNNTGSSDTVLAIIDTGFALDHEEFAGRWHQNSGETGAASAEQPSRLNCSDRSLPLNQNCNLIDDNFDGIVDNESGTTSEQNPSQLNCTDQSRSLDKSCNLVDDDGNGLVDDWRGWDFMNFDGSPQAGEINPFGSGTRHGSYVAGVAAANANNSVGIAGVNWQTQILPIQALGDGGSGTSISVARGIRYAVAQGADVISLSLGSIFPDGYTRLAVQEAIAAGVIVVAAAGNDGCNCVIYPANYPEVVAVGALASNNQPASFSSYGENLDILAPGTGMYTASWTPTNQTAAYASGIAGTSLATPLVSAMLTSLVGQDTSLSPREAIAVLTENTNRLSLPADTNWSSTLGFGTLDADTANDRLGTPYSPAQLTTYGRVSYGNMLVPGSSYEPVSTTNLYQCALNEHGTTRLYRLKKGSAELYSVSNVEIYYAELQGYTKTFFGYVCAGLSIDAPANIRVLDVFREFSNTNPKL